MREIILWYNRNKKAIFGVLGILALIVIVIQLLRWATIQDQQINQGNTLSTESDSQTNLNTVILEENKSTITGTTLSEAQTDLLEVMDEFIEYCNNNQINEAYNILSEDCKNEMYPTVDEFQRNYFDKIFNGTAKNVSTENWVGNTYKVKFIEDALSTGIYNSTRNVQDYITIIEDEEGNKKLNINSYIGKEEINKSQQAFDLKIQVLEKHQYMDFETYVYEVTNDSKNAIWLSDIENTDTIYLEDENGIKYYAYMNELSQADMKLFPGETKNIEVKYYNKYSLTKEITSIIFSGIELGGNELANFEITL